MLKSTVIGTLLGGVVLFVWSAISWMALPWHQKTMSPFKDDRAMAQVIVANADHSGVYFMPSADESLMASGPLVYAAIRREGMTTITKNLIVSVILDLIAAALVMWLLLKIAGQSFMNKVMFVVVVALTIGVVARMSDWNWWGFSLGYTIVSVAEIVIGWFLAGLVMAKFAVSRASP